MTLEKSRDYKEKSTKSQPHNNEIGYGLKI